MLTQKGKDISNDLSEIITGAHHSWNDYEAISKCFEVVLQWCEHFELRRIQKYSRVKYKLMCPTTKAWLK